MSFLMGRGGEGWGFLVYRAAQIFSDSDLRGHFAWGERNG